MLKNSQYLPFLMLLIVLTGCETINGPATCATNRSCPETQCVSNDDGSLWSDLERVDAWIRHNLW